MKNFKVIGLIVGIVVAPLALFAAMLSGGAGHGDYLAARLLFPLPMLSAYIFDEITLPAIVLACVQFPLFGWLVGSLVKKEKRRLGLVVFTLHFLALGCIFVFPDSSFS